MHYVAPWPRKSCRLFYQTLRRKTSSHRSPLLPSHAHIARDASSRTVSTHSERVCWATPTWICQECSPSPTMDRPCPPSDRPEYKATVSYTCQRPKTAIAIYIAHKLTSTASLHLLLFNIQRALVSSSIGNAPPPPMTQLTHTWCWYCI